MALQQLIYLPGVSAVDSDYSQSAQNGFASGRVAHGRYRAMDKTRFVNGLPEKIGGWTATLTGMIGIPRGMRDWRDNSQSVRVAIGTNQKLYYFSPVSFTDITPFRAILTGTLTNAFSTVNGSAIVTVAHTAHGLQTNDWVELTTSTTFNGILVANAYQVTVVDANDYTINAGALATGTGSGGGGSITFVYYRVTLTNPFATTSGSKLVTVTHVNHGAINNDFVEIANTTAVGGLTLNGEFQISNVMTSTYQITASSAATSSATGGGTPNFQYDINVGNVDTIQGFGYGTGGYGQNGYGTTGTTSVSFPARAWSIQPYGQQILCLPIGQQIYVWDPTIGGRAFPLYGSPTNLLWMFVTPERFVIALGASNSLQMAWPDQNNDTNWVPSTTNTANAGRQVQSGAFFVGGLNVKDTVNLVFTNFSAIIHQYTGDSFVFDTLPAGSNCGLAGPLAAIVLGDICYWMSTSDFWSWGGSVTALPSDDIRDFVFRNDGVSGPGINLGQAVKFFARTIASKKEVWFHYCSAASEEIDRYVIYHVDQSCFSVGTMSFTSAIDMVLQPPLGCDPSGTLFQLENGRDAAGSAIDAFIVGAPTDVASGNRNMDIMSFLPDFKRISGTVNLSVLTRFFPDDADTVYGPYAIAPDNTTPKIDFRANGKLVGFKIESNTVGGDFRVGIHRADIQPAGARI